MGQLCDWEGPLGHKRPTGKIDFWGPRDSLSLWRLRKDLLPLRDIYPEAEH